MSKSGYNINQYILDNMLVCENRKYRDLNPYLPYIADLTNSDEFKQKFRVVAQKHYREEVNKFIKGKINE